MSGPVVLALDTAGPRIGAALWDGECRTFSDRVVRGADAVLSQGLADLLEGAAPPDLLAVSVGPGAFTSLRVGVASALGISLARGCKVVPFTSLEARAYLARGERVLALLDARKGRAYAALYDRRDGELVRIGEERDLPPEDAGALAQGAPFAAIGEGALVWRDLVVAAGGTVVDDADCPPVAWMAQQAGDRHSQALNPEEVRLRYLRAPDAKKPGAMLPG